MYNSHSSGHIISILLVDGWEEKLPMSSGCVNSTFSYSIICPVCGDLWAKIYRYALEHSIDAETHLRPFRAYQLPCPHHGSGSLDELISEIFERVGFPVPHLGSHYLKRELDLICTATNENLQQPQQMANQGK